MLLTIAGRFFTTEPPGKPIIDQRCISMFLETDKINTLLSVTIPLRTGT